MSTAVEVGGGVGGSCTGDTDVSESGDTAEELEEPLEDAISLGVQQGRGLVYMRLPGNDLVATKPPSGFPEAQRPLEGEESTNSLERQDPLNGYLCSLGWSQTHYPPASVS